jgi:hypothetical protein
MSYPGVRLRFNNERKNELEIFGGETHKKRSQKESSGLRSRDSREWFRSIDLWVMSPARSHCATLLRSTVKWIDGGRRLKKLYGNRVFGSLWINKVAEFRCVVLLSAFLSLAKFFLFRAD